MRNITGSLAYLCVFVFIFILSASTKVYSQNDAQYLLDLKKVKVSGFGNTNHVLSLVDGDLAYSSGGSGAFLFDYKFFVGIYTQNLKTTHSREDIYSPAFNPNVNPTESPIFKKNKLHFNHSGLWLGYIHKPNSLVHWGANMRFGVGNISLSDKGVNFDYQEDHHSDFIGTIIPEFDIELNIARWFKINMGIGYRFVLFTDKTVYRNAAGNDIRLYESSQFSSPTATIKLMFGSFGPKSKIKREADSN